MLFRSLDLGLDLGLFGLHLGLLGLDLGLLSLHLGLLGDLLVQILDGGGEGFYV